MVYATTRWFLQRTSGPPLGPAVFLSVLRVVLLGTVLLVVGLFSVQGAAAQSLTSSSRPASADTAALRRGVVAVQSGAYAKARALLAPLTGTPAAHHPRHGSAALWLGRAFYREGDTSRAQQVWAQAVFRAERDSSVVAGAADALLRSMPPRTLRAYEDHATRAFYHLVGTMDTARSAVADTVLRRHAAQLAAITPDSISARLARRASGERPASASDAATDAALGTVVLRWLEAQDPVLATDANERAIEHLVRLHIAERRYTWSGRPSGLDDRGLVYLRYGAPGRKMSVTYNDPGRRVLGIGERAITVPPVREVIPDLDVPRSTIPRENEVWHYPDLGPLATHLFVRRSEPGGPYLEGTVEDLFPPSLRQPPVRTQRRSEGMAYLAVYAMVYEQLARMSGRYAQWYDRLLSYSPLTGLPLANYMRNVIADSQHEQRMMLREREERVARQQTRTLTGREPLPLAVRTARFLRPDGTTRLEVYWSASAGRLPPSEDWMHGVMQMGHRPSGNYVVYTSGTLRTPGLQMRDRQRRADTVSVEMVAAQQRLPTRSLVFDGLVDRARVDLEWIQQPIGTEGALGPVARITRRDTTIQSALAAGPSRLEMSDVRLLSVPDDGLPLPASEAEARRRTIPFQKVAAGPALALAFEVYHLTFSASDRTRYTVEYAITRTQGAGGIAGFFGGEQTDATATTSTYEGPSRRTEEYILLDLATGVNLERPIDVTVTVRVTDEVSGQTVERPVAFTLVPSPPSS